MAKRKRLQVIEDQVEQDHRDAGHSLAAWTAREDTRLDEEPDHYGRLERLARDVGRAEFAKLRVAPRNKGDAARRLADAATMKAVGDSADFVRDGVVFPLLRVVLGHARPHEGREPKSARFRDELEALRAFVGTPSERSVAQFGATLGRIALGATVQSSRVEFTPPTDEGLEVVGKALAAVDAADPGAAQLLVWWFVESHPPVPHRDAEGHKVPGCDEWGSAQALAFAMREKGAPAPPWSRLRAPVVSAALLVAERAGLEPDEHNARIVQGRVRRARRALREALWDARLTTEPTRVIAP